MKRAEAMIECELEMCPHTPTVENSENLATNLDKAIAAVSMAKPQENEQGGNSTAFFSEILSRLSDMSVKFSAELAEVKAEAKAAKEEAAAANAKLNAANGKLDAAARERAELRELLEEVLDGGAELSLAAAVRLLQETRHLTPKEAEVWMLAQQGKKQGEIAEAAGINQGTVSRMLSRFENDPHLKRVKVRAVRQTRGGEVRG